MSGFGAEADKFTIISMVADFYRSTANFTVFGIDLFWDGKIQQHGY